MVHHSIRISVWLMCILLGLAGCTTTKQLTPTPSTLSFKQREQQLLHLSSWQLNGKIAVQTAQDAGSATVDWTQHGSNYLISLLGPLGSHGLTLTGQPGLVTLKTADGKTASAANPEQLLSQHWGFHLPVSNLRYWVRGLPVPTMPYQSEFDNNHRLARLMQQGWQVEYPNYTHIGTFDLPEKIVITSSALRVKMVIYQWKIV